MNKRVISKQQFEGCPCCGNKAFQENTDIIETSWLSTNCYCEKCNKYFNRGYTLSGVSYWEDENNCDSRKIWSIDLNKKEKNTLLKALNCLIDSEQDTRSYEEITRKLIGDAIEEIEDGEKDLNKLEEENEAKSSFICSDCINKEMEEE